MSRRVAVTSLLRKNQLVGGVASVIQNLTRGMALLVRDDPAYRDLEITVLHGPAGPPVRCDGLLYESRNLKCGRFAAETLFGVSGAQRYDASLFTNYFTPPVARSTRNVTIIHDLLHHHFPRLVPAKKRFWLRQCHRLTLSRADTVVTISQAVKDDILEVYGAKYESKIRPIWNPIDLERFGGDEPQFDPTQKRPYVLGVAVDRPSKNLASLVWAFHLLKDRLPDHVLVLCGELRSRRPETKTLGKHVAKELPSALELVDQLQLSDRVKVTGFVSDAELGVLYRGAAVFVMPSLFEGFGMPPVEAMSFGVPTLVSGIPVLKEITLGQAEYLENPQNPKEIAERILAMVQAGASARIPDQIVEQLRQTFAPQTIANQYLSTLLG